MKKNIDSIIIIVVLLILIGIRIADCGNSAWISFVNFLGLPMALYGLLKQLHNSTKFCRGIVSLILIALIGFSVFLLTGVIVLTSQINDIILLVTLLITLPSNYYSFLLRKKQ